MAAPSQVHSLGAPVTLNGPVVSGEYSRAHLVDGSLDQPCRMGWGTVQITLDLQQTRTPNLVGVLNHNIDFDRVIGITNEAGLNRGFGARDPNCWIDLRGFPTTARYWTLAINENSHPVSIGEIVIATATVFGDGLWDGEPGFTEKLSYPGFRDATEYLKAYVSSSGAIVRTAEPTLTLSEADRVKLAAIFTEVMTVTGRQVLIVPSSRLNDIWLVDWPVLEEATFENPLLRTMNLALYEAVGAVLNGR